MWRRAAIVGGVALGAVFGLTVILAIVLLFAMGPESVFDVAGGGEPFHEGHVNAPNIDASDGLALEEARQMAAHALESDGAVCPHILGEDLGVAFGSGISIENEGVWYLRARCSDDAYLVAVSAEGVEAKTCAAARDVGESC